MDCFDFADATLSPAARRAIQDEGNIYDVPLSNERATVDTQPGYSETEENIYDVPSSLLRRLSGQSIGLESEGAWPSDSGCVSEDDDSGFRGGMVGWMTSAAEGAVDQTVTNVTAGLLELRANQGFP
ncbi:hypothetical protein GJAV_G00223640 [Gymnothorax javanicus]|nr:hypothetical protein GJAV_G00223640 [Gymnothorax javanicus]